MVYTHVCVCVCDCALVEGKKNGSKHKKAWRRIFKYLNIYMILSINKKKVFIDNKI